MELVLVERRFEQPVQFEDIQSLETADSSCFQVRGVRFLKSFFSRDRCRMLCLFEAPDAESVRDAETQAKVPYNSAWTCRSLKGDGKLHVANASGEYIVVERLFPEAVTPESILKAVQRSGWCFDLYAAERVESFLGNDGRRMVCLFRAPDAEAVRKANQKADAVYTEVWTASVHIGSE